MEQEQPETIETSGRTQKEGGNRMKKAVYVLVAVVVLLGLAACSPTVRQTVQDGTTAVLGGGEAQQWQAVVQGETIEYSIESVEEHAGVYNPTRLGSQVLASTLSDSCRVVVLEPFVQEELDQEHVRVLAYNVANCLNVLKDLNNNGFATRVDFIFAYADSYLEECSSAQYLGWIRDERECENFPAIEDVRPQ